MKLSTLIFSIVFPLLAQLSCTQAPTDIPNQESIPSDGNSTQAIIEKLPISPPMKKWTNMEMVPESWIKLEADSLGYFIPALCNGNNTTIDLENLLTINQLGKSQRFQCVKSFVNSDSLGCGIVAFDLDSSNEEDVFFDLSIIDGQLKLVKWSFGNANKKIDWIMTPLEYADEFRTIAVPCPEK